MADSKKNKCSLTILKEKKKKENGLFVRCLPISVPSLYSNGVQQKKALAPPRTLGQEEFIYIVQH